MKRIAFTMAFLTVCIIAGFANAQTQSANTRLIETEKMVTAAQSQMVNAYSPETFEELEKELKEAKSDLIKGKSEKDIQEKLSKVSSLLRTALENTQQVKKQLPDLLQAREDAIIAEAPEYAIELFNDGEKAFQKAVREIEDRDINEAIKEGKKGEDHFRRSELKAIKATIIGKTRDLIKQAENIKADKYAPVTFTKAQDLLADAEKTLETDRGAQATARKKAEQASYQAQHSIYLSKNIQEWRREDENWERIILESESQIQSLGDLYGFVLKFDQGLSMPVNNLVSAIKSLQENNRSMSEELDLLNSQLNQTRKDLAQITSELDKSKSEEQQLKAKLEAEERREAKFHRIETLFNEKEALVLREGTRIILRLVGLSFSSGKSDIEAQYFGLLTKIQRAIREFPYAQITIEGHTDALGHETANMQLSTRRAEAVRTYLMANMNLEPEQVVAVGFGENKPIASNDTKTGRAQNRRIDLFLDIDDLTY
jgi:OmpA-OmpF porin, OOP family